MTKQLLIQLILNKAKQLTIEHRETLKILDSKTGERIQFGLGLNYGLNSIIEIIQKHQSNVKAIQKTNTSKKETEH